TDLREGMISMSAATDVYGVVLNHAGDIDIQATVARRDALGQAPAKFQLVACLDSYEPGLVSKRRICRMHPDDARQLGLSHDDLVELDARNGAPLRAWLRMDSNVVRGCVPIDQHGITMLQARVDDHIEIRGIPRPAVSVSGSRLREAAAHNEDTLIVSTV